MFLLHFESLGLCNYDLTPQQNHRYISNLKDSQKGIVSRRITHKHSHLIVSALYNCIYSIHCHIQYHHGREFFLLPCLRDELH